MISRRTFAVAVAGVVLGRPPVVRAQQAEKVYRIGCLMIGAQQSGDVFREFVEGMRELGYVEGRNLVLEVRRTEGSLEQVRALADDLVRLKVDVMVTGGDREAL